MRFLREEILGAEEGSHVIKEGGVVESYLEVKTIRTKSCLGRKQEHPRQRKKERIGDEQEL